MMKNRCWKGANKIDVIYFKPPSRPPLLKMATDSACGLDYFHKYKQDRDRVLAYRRHHADQDGVFYNPIEEQYYNQLLQGLANAMNASEGNPIDQHELISIFENVFGTRRGYPRGLGPKPAHGSEGSLMIRQIILHRGMQAMFMDPSFQQYMQQCYSLSPPTILQEWQQRPGDRSVNHLVDQYGYDTYD